MTISSMALAEKALKEFLLEPFVKQLDERSGPFLAMILKNSEDVAGYKIKMPVQFGSTGGIGNRPDDGTTPESSPRDWEQAEWGTKNIYSTIALTSKLLKASRKDKGAFANMLTTYMEDAAKDANTDLRRQLFGDGTGILATLSAGTDVNALSADALKYILLGQIIDICASDGTVKTAKRKIINKDKVNTKFTIDGTGVTVVNGDIVTRNGNYGNELTGLKSLFTAGNTYCGIDRSSASWWEANIVDNASAELDEIVMQQCIDEADEEVGSEINFIMAAYDVARAYQYIQQTYKRNVEYMDLKGGYKAMSFNGTPISREKFMPDGTMDFLNTKDFKLYRMDDWDWMSEDGNILKKISGKAAYEAVLEWYGDLGCKRPAGQTRLINIIGH